MVDPAEQGAVELEPQAEPAAAELVVDRQRHADPDTHSAEEPAEQD